jgi:hypothetical protein
MTALITDSIFGLQNRYEGQRCWVVGSGPSLDGLDLSRLGDENVIALNAAITLFQDRRRHPNTWWMIRDARAYDEVYPRLGKLRFLKLIVSQKGYKRFKESGIWKQLSGQAFVFDVARYIHRRTVAEDAIQIAAYMGFEEVNLLGIDCAIRDNQHYAKALSWKDCHFHDERADVVVGVRPVQAMVDALAALPKDLGELLPKVYQASPLFPAGTYEHRSFENGLAAR